MYLFISVCIKKGKPIALPSFIHSSKELVEQFIEKVKKEESTVAISIFNTDPYRFKDVECYFDKNGKPKKDSVIFHSTRPLNGKWKDEIKSS